ncbi:MAG: ABC transporter substrate-binding protein [Synergistaceae bacterium]|jgi:hypothetical protein|nr:ABC transporter substrate-binding protein [Synergistaceae bacterium]
MRDETKKISRLKIFFSLFTIAFLVAMTQLSSGMTPAHAADDDDPLLGVREGWAWPVVVIQPPEGWDSEAGTSIKYAMRAAEREISIQREAIRGREVTFMFSDVNSIAELPSRLATWRAMKVSVIISFADSELNLHLAELCRSSGPSVILAAGEDASLMNPQTGAPYQYLFALDLPYYARANALAIAAKRERPEKKAAVITDILSEKLARGAELNVELLRTSGVDVLDLSLAAYRQDQFTPQVADAIEGGYHVFTCWLDAMATLSIWRSAARRDDLSVVFYSGNQHKILLDATGVVLVDKDVLLERDEKGKHDIIIKIRDYFDREPGDPVVAARAYTLARWAIGAYIASDSETNERLSRALGEVTDIPLMDEILSIDSRTHRPKSRKFGVLRITNRTYESSGSVEVFSVDVVE